MLEHMQIKLLRICPFLGNTHVICKSSVRKYCIEGNHTIYEVQVHIHLHPSFLNIDHRSTIDPFDINPSLVPMSNSAAARPSYKLW